jgi:putative Holliday junction resolvase
VRSAPGRVLGVDYGEKRIGLALSDSLRMVATPLETVDGSQPKVAFRRLRDLIAEHDVKEVVVGLPLHMDGGRGELVTAAEAFAAKLRAQVPGLPVHLWDERLSTAEAERAMRSGAAKAARRKELRDQLAAQLILQSWLDTHAEPSADPWET